MDRAVALGIKEGAALVLATDPDADRLGAEVPDGRGGFRFITGNEIAALVTWFKLGKLQQAGRMPASPIVVNSLVTTSLTTRIGRHFGAQVIDNLLVGFKYVAEVLWQLEQQGGYEDVRGTPEDYVIGTEESHGILAMPQVRDKDAGAGALLMAELALDLKRQGRTVLDALDSLARQFGYFRNEVINIVMTGIEGKQNMARMLDRMRAEPPRAIAGLAVTHLEDLRDERGRLGPIKGATDAAARNVLVFRLGDEARIVLRPSGTEPKAKAYIEVSSAPCQPNCPPGRWQAICRGVDATTQQLADEFLKLTLSLVGQQPPAGSVKLSR
jgi:phosphoglucomutase/phosphomannomutase